MQAHKHTSRNTSEHFRRRQSFYWWWQSKAGVKKDFHHLLYMKASVVSFLDSFFSHYTALLRHISITEVYIENLHNAFIRNAITQAKIPLYKGASTQGWREQKRETGIGTIHAFVLHIILQNPIVLGCSRHPFVCQVIQDR